MASAASAARSSRPPASAARGAGLERGDALAESRLALVLAGLFRRRGGQRALGRGEGRLGVAHLLVEQQEGVTVGHLLGRRRGRAAGQGDKRLEHRRNSVMNDVQSTPDREHGSR